MALLKDELQEKFNSLFSGCNLCTDIDFAQMTADQMTDPLQKKKDMYIKCKDFLFNGYNHLIKADLIQERDPISTSMDFLFGGPFYRGEVTSIEGSSSTGKTRLCLKIAHEVSQAGRVLYIDSDFTLQPNILGKIRETLGLENTVQPTYGVADITNPNDVSSFHICSCTNIIELYDSINQYFSQANADLIVIDSLIALFQSTTSKDGPGSAMLQEFAIELKHLVQEKNCVAIVTNVLRRDPGNRKPFLGRLYCSLWHQRLQLFSRNYITSQCKLVASQRYREQMHLLSLQRMTECHDEVGDFEEV
ncbi:DNA repair protein RAD51 4 isoform X1 [Histomonas meleagridis]|uniref:DNA repair protein RAD51-like 4 isoform X1 n=1 Tax=Histomonas meleagridis TaxID=135588 RepID=UPI003559D04A|nr:DNA repair protein RAD51 4 isoform X1 [Histomonas meleagridis]KAH0801679.1 DNA repair protein RAD51-like 4 isoform X1 [Histomonas meleagridis]